MTTLIERLSRCYTGVVHDVLRGMGHKNFTLPKDVRPILPEMVLAGPVFTILGRPAPGADPHETLVAWTGLLSQAPAGHVWMSQPNDDAVAHMGELSAETLQRRGVLGAVADGAIRDVNFLIALEFPCWSRGFTPRDIVGAWLPEATDVPITIGEATINPGDYCLGDRDGMVIVPAAMVDEVIETAETAMATESRVRSAILAGMDPQEAYLKFGKF